MAENVHCLLTALREAEACMETFEVEDEVHDYVEHLKAATPGIGMSRSRRAQLDPLLQLTLEQNTASPPRKMRSTQQHMDLLMSHQPDFRLAPGYRSFQTACWNMRPREPQYFETQLASRTMDAP